MKIQLFFRDLMRKRTLPGLLVGLSFPLVSWILDAMLRHGRFSFALIPTLHKNYPIHWLIDTLPLLFLFIIWRQNRQHRLLLTQKELLMELISEKNRHLQHISTHDPLTGLHNRDELNKLLQKSLQNAEKNGEKFALLQLDLDNFRKINDYKGLEIGNLVLKKTAERLKTLTRRSDWICRTGGDEITIILNALKSQSDAVTVAEKILAAVSLPIIIDEKLRVTCSIGISRFPEDGRRQEVLMRKADQALSMAKIHGKNTYMLFDQEYQSTLDREKSIGEYMRLALENKEFTLHYQPKFDSKLRISGMEALARWDSIEHGKISPSHFIPVAEKTGMISALGEWALFHACDNTRRWHDTGLPPVKVAVNLSVFQLRTPGFVENIRKILEETGLSARFLEVELTESGAMQNVKESREIINALHRMGMSVAIDDFGTGYSSMNQLVRMPIDVLKIDKSFVDNLPKSKKSTTLARLIIDMAKSLDLEVVAEGVENREQYNSLREMQCDQLQGFFLSKPLEAEQFEGLLRVNAHLTGSLN